MSYIAMKSRRSTRSEGSRRLYRLSKTKPMGAAEDFFRRNILINAAIAGGEDGYYTWIFKGSLMAAARTRSEQEVGTLHANLVALTPDGPVIAAGEFTKAGNTILFNLQSGTYMAKVFRPIKSQRVKMEKRNELIGIAITEFARCGLAATFVEAPPGATPEETLAGAPMIDNAVIVTALSDIAEYDALLSGSNVDSNSH